MLFNAKSCLNIYIYIYIYIYIRVCVCVCVCVCVEKVKPKKICLMVCLFANAFQLQSFLNAKVFHQNYFSMRNDYNR